MQVAGFSIVKPPYLRYNNPVRLDLFLKASRLVKRRMVAREMCEAGRVLLNGREAKPAREVRPGDLITLKYSSRLLEVEVVGMLALSSKKTPAEELYRIKAETRLQKEKDPWSESLS